MKKTSLIKCQTYEEREVENAVRQAILMIEGFKDRIKPDMNVVIKANLVGGHRPEECATTHPAVIQAVVKMVQECGANAIIADSPGAGYTKNRLKPIYDICGMTAVSEKTGAELNYDFSSQMCDYEQAYAGRRMDLISVLLNADLIINVAKYKTHRFTGYTGAAKNMFGAIAGFTKVEVHGSHTDIFKFCDYLLDIQNFFKDKMVLHVVDAVVGMEGEGPTGGKPKAINAIVASECPYSADSLLLYLTNNNIKAMPVISRAIEHKLFEFDESTFLNEVVGDDATQMIVSDFDNVKVMSNSPLFKIPKFIAPLFYHLSAQRPIIKKRKCKGCRKCMEHCPPKAITMSKNKAIVDFKKCIRCFCCQELCPYHIIKIKTPLLAKVFRILR